jgi:hypothetical protein
MLPMTKPPEVIERENKEKALQNALIQKAQGKATLDDIYEQNRVIINLLLEIKGK